MIMVWQLSLLIDIASVQGGLSTAADQGLLLTDMPILDTATVVVGVIATSTLTALVIVNLANASSLCSGG